MRDSVLSVARIFLGEYSLNAEGILLLMDWVVGPQVTTSMMCQLTHVMTLDPNKKCARK